MWVYPVLVLALGALWPLDWRYTRLDSLSPVTGHYHGTTWAMAEKATGGDGTDEELLVLEGNTSDEVGKNKESQKGLFAKWGTDGILLVVLLVALVIALLAVVAAAVVKGNGDSKEMWWITGVLLVFIIVIIIYNRNMLIKNIFCMGNSGSSLKKMNAKNVN